jgi:transcriptional regulator with XRE-family HTH domain
MTLNLTFGDLIATARLNRGWTQNRLAEVVGMSPQYLCDIERGRRTPAHLDVVKRFSAVLEINLDVLCWSVGLLPPDLPDNVSPQQITAAFAAMREVLGCTR